MATVQLMFGPTDHGRPVAPEELTSAGYIEGYNYEIIDGCFYVSPRPSLAEVRLEMWLSGKLEHVEETQPDLIDWVSNKARVFVASRPKLTVPEPDLAAYRGFPHDTPIGDLRWEDVSPIIVGEVLVDGDADKDLVRNVDLYLQVPSIAEYWLLDGRENPNEPILVARRRHRDRWLIREVPYGEEYSPPTLPGFTFLIDPRK